jgi:hypothetical protein
MWLLFFGMREKEIGFARQQMFYWHFLDTQQHTAIRKVFGQFDAGVAVLQVTETPFCRGLHGNRNAWVVRHNPFALQGRKGNAVIVRYFLFPYESDVYLFSHNVG